MLAEAVAAAGSLFGPLQSPDARNQERYRQAEALAAKARAGNTAAEAELDRLSREFATDVAKQYAAQLLAQLRAARTGPAAAVPVAPAAAAPTALEQVTAPLTEALATTEAQVREAVAQVLERAGVGAAAASARAVRGTEGPLDRAIALATSPGGLVVGALVGVGLLVGLTVLVVRR